MQNELAPKRSHTPWFLRMVGKVMMMLSGWKASIDIPADLKKAVVVSFPHTSNWDFYHAMAILWSQDLPFRFLAKHTLFKGLQGWFLKKVGGIPVDRTAAHGLVGEAARMLREAEEMFLLVAVEGTRSYRPYWKSGFYHIAEQGGVPVIAGFLDYPNKRGGFDTVVEVTGDPKADMNRFREVYKGYTGRRPAKQSAIRLRSEDG